MAYEKQTWNTGDVITAEKLNHMEEGIGNAVYVHVTQNNDGYESDLSASEIVELIENGKTVFALYGGSMGDGDGTLYFILAPITFSSSPTHSVIFNSRMPIINSTTSSKTLSESFIRITGNTCTLETISIQGT